MATESPLVHDGSQCVAAADYSPTGSSLAGMNGSGQFLAVYISAARTVTVNGTAATVSYGILQNQPKAGQAADIGILGVTKAMVGTGGCAAGDLLMVTSTGALTTKTSTNAVVGQALEAGTAGQVISIAIAPTIG